MEQKQIIALGFFDGVHRGHQALLKACVELAAERDAQPAAITFQKHPQSLFILQTPPLINTLEDRCRLLVKYGMLQILAYPVDNKIMSTDWQDFLDMLVGSGAVGFVCGDDFRFGKRGEGNGEKLLEYCVRHDLPCVIIPEQTMDDTRVSSTYIRRQIESGDMATAVRFLGHPHILSGKVMPGRQLGRTIGVPTANILLPEGIAVPRHGVYAGKCAIEGTQYLTVTNIGSRPTVQGHQIRAESWILDFEGDLYGKKLTLEFYKFLRPEQTFASLEELRSQIQKDADQTRAFFRIAGL